MSLLLLSMLLAWAAPASATGCASLSGRAFGYARVVSVEHSAGPLEVASVAAPTGRSVVVRTPFCRVVGVMRPVAGSEIRFEVWLPEPGAWNGRVEGIGNGGFAGAIAYGGLAWALEGGYAVVSTDTGHSGDPSESSWAIGHPERIVDLGWRAVHETTVAAKAVVTAYYGRAAHHAYFAGCSTGGRQALVEAQRFPADYDGIVAGAPAYDWPRLLAFDAEIYRLLLLRPGAWLSPAKLTMLAEASQEYCGGVGGLIDDPGACRFDYGRLRCRAGASSECLDGAEMAMADLMYGGLRDRNGRSLYPGFTPGSEKSWGVWRLGSRGRAGSDALAYPYPNGFYGRLVHQDAGWTVARFDLDRDFEAADESGVTAAVDSRDPDLRAFFARGGRLIQYHGWQDPAIPAASSIGYYRAVSTFVGAPRTDEHYRLFLGTGMLHCAGGPGPDAVGGASPRPPVRDALHDVVEAVVAWTEAGRAPEAIVASHHRGGDPEAPVDGQRPWCPWPSRPGYVGGDRTEPKSFRCERPEG